MYQTTLNTIYEALSDSKTTNRTTLVTRQPVRTLDAWVRHASSSNGFSDAFDRDHGHTSLPFTKV